MPAKYDQKISLTDLKMFSLCLGPDVLPLSAAHHFPFAEIFSSVTLKPPDW